MSLHVLLSEAWFATIKTPNVESMVGWRNANVKLATRCRVNRMFAIATATSVACAEKMAVCVTRGLIQPRIVQPVCHFTCPSNPIAASTATQTLHAWAGDHAGKRRMAI